MKAKLLFFVLLLPLAGFCQEFNCIVKVDASATQTINKEIFTEIEQSISLFMNEYRWTKDSYEPEERINLFINVDITQQNSLNSFEATAIISSTRPVYGTDYESPIMTIFDRDFNFVYNQGEDLIFNETGFNTNLMSMLAFYAYYALGMDYDSFSMLGGTEYFQKAQNIVNIAQNLSSDGWQEEKGPNNRYWLLDNILNNQFRTFREGTYTYYRVAFDKFTEDPVTAQEAIIKILNDIKKIRELNPSSFLLKSFFTARQKELIDIYKGADTDMKSKGMNALIAADPTNQTKYRSIIDR